MSIIIIDSSSAAREQLRQLLNQSGYLQLMEADCGETAWQYLTAAAGVDIELIILDLMTAAGTALCRRIKAEASLQDIPIIIISAIADPHEIQQAFDAGAIDYITQPYNETILLARVRSAIKLNQEMNRRKAREKELTEISNLLEEACRNIQQFSLLDGLTGVANRRRFDESLHREWRRAMRSGGPLSLVMIDVDFFKSYNDTYGHYDGDKCLIKVAQTLNSELKRPGDLVARYGGEEFAIILPETPMEGAMLVAEKIRVQVAALNIPHSNSNVCPHVTISLGVATIVPRRELSLMELITAADQALYQAKHNGRNRVMMAG